VWRRVAFARYMMKEAARAEDVAAHVGLDALLKLGRRVRALARHVEPYVGEHRLERVVELHGVRAQRAVNDVRAMNRVERHQNAPHEISERSRRPRERVKILGSARGPQIGHERVAADRRPVNAEDAGNAVCLRQRAHVIDRHREAQSIVLLHHERVDQHECHRFVLGGRRSKRADRRTRTEGLADLHAERGTRRLFGRRRLRTYGRLLDRILLAHDTPHHASLVIRRGSPRKSTARA
jgi:hypothetical protein